jgi:predicted phosphoribosyltransferase
MPDSAKVMYRDRTHAGTVLAEELRRAIEEPLLILALPRGGVVVAVEAARHLDAELDVLVVRKIGVPAQEELAMGAVGAGGVYVLHERLVQRLGLEDRTCQELIAQRRSEAQARDRRYRGGAPPPDLAGRRVCLIDDGLATGSTMAAAVQIVRRQGPAMIIVAVPVAPPDTCAAFARSVDLFICPRRPQDFGSVGAWYEDFSEVTDEQVCTLLRQTAQARVSSGRSTGS